MIKLLPKTLKGLYEANNRIIEGIYKFVHKKGKKIVAKMAKIVVFTYIDVKNMVRYYD